MSPSFITKFFPTLATTLGLVTISNFILINSVDAFSVTFSNGGFEDTSDGVGTGTGSPNNWSTIGDVYTTGTRDGIAPLSGSNQAIITTGYIQGTYGSPVGNRNDDSDLNFNESGINPVSADNNPNADDLQEFLGLNSDAFSIERTGADPGITDPRTSKEGSGMYQQFNVTLDSGETGFTVNFNWSYLTNDGSTAFGDQDFGFWSLGQVNGSTYTTAFDGSEDGFSTNEIAVLQSSNGSISTPSGPQDYVDNSSDYASNGLYSYTVDGLTPGTYTYRAAFGVVDVDNLSRTSALMIDDFSVEEVPFEFSPTAGIALVLGLLGCDRLRRKMKISN